MELVTPYDLKGVSGRPTTETSLSVEVGEDTEKVICRTTKDQDFIKDSPLSTNLITRTYCLFFVDEDIVSEEG